MSTTSLTSTPWTSPSTAVSVRAQKYQTHSCRASLGGIVGRKLSIKARLPCSARFISVLTVAPRGETSKRNGIFALDPDFYKIPYVEGVPVGKRLYIWNLPQNCDPDEFKQWFDGLDGVSVDSVEFTDDPELNARGIGGFIEFGTKQEACMAIVRRDGHKFRGKCVRMDFVEKKPHEREFGGRRNRPSYRSSRQSSSYNYGSTSGYGSGSSARSGYGNASSTGAAVPVSSSYGGSPKPSSNVPTPVASSTPQTSTSSVQGSNSNQPTSPPTGYQVSAVQENPTTTTLTANTSTTGNYASTPSYGGSQSQPGYGNTPYYQSYGNAQAGETQSNSSYAGQVSPSYANNPSSAIDISTNQATLTQDTSGFNYGNTQVPQSYSSNESSATYADDKNTNQSSSVYSNTNAPGYGYNAQSAPSNYQSSQGYQAGNEMRDSGAGYVNAPSYNNPNYEGYTNTGYGRSEYGAQSFGRSEFRPPYTSNPGYASPRPSSLYKVFVGNLPWSTDDMRLQQLFNEYGTVLEAKVVRDRDSGRSRGFGFVSMSTADEMRAAIDGLDGSQLEGRPLKVNEAATRY